MRMAAFEGQPTVSRVLHTLVSLHAEQTLAYNLCQPPLCLADVLVASNSPRCRPRRRVTLILE